MTDRGSARRGRFITFEGGEGAGKSTQVRLLAAWLGQRGIDVLATREPGGSAGAERIRGLLVEGDAARWDPLTETLLHYGARRDHVERTIRPALAANRWVVCDRFADSTTAYQGYGHGVSLEFIATLRHQVVGTDCAPDLTVVLDLPVEAGLRRASSRPGSETRYESMSVEFHRRLREGFLTIAKAEPDRCVVVDASADIDAVQSAVRAAVERRLAPIGSKPA
jgi:dTMP kinase